MNFIHNNTEELSAIGAFILMRITINWYDKIAGAAISFCFSLLVGLAVRLFKKYQVGERIWEFITRKKKDGKKD